MLEAKVSPRTKVLMLNFPNNPTGAVMLRSDLEDITAFVREHDLLVITDEIYAELTYDNPHTSIVSLPGMRERTLFLHGFSKAWAMTGFRLGYACGPAELIDAMMRVHQYTMLCASSVAQKAALEAITRREADVGEMVAEYRRRRNYMVNSFAKWYCVSPALGAFTRFSIAQFGLSSKDFDAPVAGGKCRSAGHGFGASAKVFSLRLRTWLANIEEAMVRLKRFISRQPTGDPRLDHRLPGGGHDFI